MSKQPYDGYILNVIRMYPKLKTIDTPSKKQVFWKSAVESAILETEKLPDGLERLKIIDLLFWRRTHTMDGVAIHLHLSYETVRRRRRSFLRMVEKKLINF